MTAGLYVLHSLVWSASGFVLGWLLGHLGREVSAMSNSPVANGDTTPRSTRPHWLRRFGGLEPVIGLVVVVLAALTMIMTVSVNTRLERVITCQAEFNIEYRGALAERTEAADQERAAQRKLLVTISSASADPAERARQNRQAMTDYIGELNAADQRRNQNPLPPPRRCM